jgi:SAM-dependent methyltransferase
VLGSPDAGTARIDARPRAGPGLLANPSPYSRAVNMDQVRQAYASVAELYIEMFGTSQQVHADYLAFIGRHLAGQPGRVLDLGCGPGHITDYLRSLGVDATGIDMVPEFIAHAQAAHPSGSYQLGSFEDLAAARHSIAGILAWGSLSIYRRKILTACSRSSGE